MARKITITPRDTSPEARQPIGKIRIDADRVAEMGKKLEEARLAQDRIRSVARIRTPARCSKDGRDFSVIIEEREPGHWVVARTDTSLDGALGESSNALGTASHLDWSEYAGCPHCGHRAVVKHLDHDGVLSCLGGSFSDKGKTALRCPWCEQTVYPVGTFDDLSGTRETTAKGKGGK